MVLKNVDYQTKNGCSQHDVENRLLDAAEKLFSEKGFNATSVRDLTSEADCNVAAVNYHFGSKEDLYKAMLHRHMNRVFSMQKQNIRKVMDSENPTLEKLLSAITKTTLETFEQESSPIPMLKLTIRQSLNPQFKDDVAAMESVKDLLSEIKRALIKLLPSLDEERAMLCVCSIEGLIIHPLLFGEKYPQVIPDFDFNKLIAHIVEFASAGIRQAAQSSK